LEERVRCFPAEYEAHYLRDWPSCPADLTLTAGATRSAERFIEVTLPDGSSWTATVAGLAGAPVRAVSGLFATPSPGHLLAVERGAAYLLDVSRPAVSVHIETGGAVTALRAVPEMELLLMCTDWTVIAIGKSGVAWRTQRLSIEEIRIDETEGARARGVADPDSDEPRDFMIDLKTGSILGGAQVI
jgi:hypothetical protein